MSLSPSVFFFFFNDTATTEIYTLSLHDALPISHAGLVQRAAAAAVCNLHAQAEDEGAHQQADAGRAQGRSEEHTSELQSQSNLVCRLLLEKKKTKNLSRSRPEQSPHTSALTGYF